MLTTAAMSTYSSWVEPWLQNTPSTSEMAVRMSERLPPMASTATIKDTETTAAMSTYSVWVEPHRPACRVPGRASRAGSVFIPARIPR